ncbi:MAG: acetolactate synthase large subunit, partial [Acidipropionibacterium jensenii]|nr:acetolactate synthase large subunit [Acidipropionibacterium jensenii]
MNTDRTVARLITECLRQEGVEVVFGIPGEENIQLVQEIHDDPSIRFVLVRHEQGASFMADVYGRLTGRAGVCTATLGPGAINLLLGVTDATTDSVPVVAISAQVGLNRIYKESHQIVDLETMFAPVTKWSATIQRPEAVPEMLRKAFDLAQAERPGATYIAVPQDVESEIADASLVPLVSRPTHHALPDPAQIDAAIQALQTAHSPIVLAGHGVARSHAEVPLRELVATLNLPLATPFQAKGVLPA